MTHAQLRRATNVYPSPGSLELPGRWPDATAALGDRLPGAVLRWAGAEGERARGRFQARFAGFDAVLGPTLPCPPRPWSSSTASVWCGPCCARCR